MILLVLVAGLTPPALSDGVEAFCTQVAQLAAPQVAAHSIAVQLVAEGAASELADEITGRCTRDLLGDTPPASLAAAERVVRIHARLAGSSLAATVEVTQSDKVLLAGTVEVPAGAKLVHWLSAGGTGLETWLAGAVDGEVLALCGDDPEGDARAEVAFVTRSAIEFVRWTGAGFEPIAKVDLPTTLRARARAAGASAACRVVDGSLELVFGIHDRGRGGVVRLAHGVAEPLQPLDGIPFGFAHTGEPLVAEGVSGTGLARWKGTEVAAIVASAHKRKEGDSVDIVWVSQMGTSPALGVKAGAALAVADVDGDHRAELVYERAVFSGDGDDDRLVVAPLATPKSVRYQSTPIGGVLGALGVVTVGSWQRVLAVQKVEGQSRIYALGTRTPPSTIH